MLGGRTLGCLATFLFALAGGLVGCAPGDDPSADNHGYGWTYDEAGETGLRLRYAPEVAVEERSPLDRLEVAFAEVRACVGVDAPGPLVVVVPRGALDGHPEVNVAPGHHVGGLYYFDTDLVVVTASLYAFRHELVHYLLDRARFPVDLNRAHRHRAFVACTGPLLRG